MKIQFDAEKHRYTLDGKAVPSVTQVLKVLEDYQGWPLGAATRGTHAHMMTQFYDEDDLDLDTVADDLKGYLAAYALFHIENPLSLDWSTTKAEVPVGSKAGYCGTIDRISDEWIVDIKSGTVAKTHPHQLHAYAQAASETIGGKRRKMALVYLQDCGSYRVKVVKWDGVVWGQFLAALTVHNFKHGGKLQ